ncbi:MAG TPA: hypothetical protein VEW67_02955, partial [Thermoleophilaceae bacterium]|nr:hypothetical protein [Thermoleophilaceae bacterium]
MGIGEKERRLIDFPLEELPSIDEHGTLVHAPVDVTWQALLSVIPRSFAGRASERFVSTLGCTHTEEEGPVDRIGSTIPGFMVARVIEPAVLALEGEHRFSRYGLIFRLEPTKDDRTLLRAESRAEFPGFKGTLYRGLVVGTRG